MKEKKDIKASRVKKSSYEERKKRRRMKKKRRHEEENKTNKELRVTLERYTQNIKPEDNEREEENKYNSTNKISSPVEKKPSSEHRSHLLELRKRRGSDLWVKCSKNVCNKWLLLEEEPDPTNVPPKLMCFIHQDKDGNKEPRKCSYTENNHNPPISDFIYIKYTAGSLVLARMNGYPWWPAMVDDCPDVMSFYWLQGNSREPIDYHVTFFDSESRCTKRAWINRANLRPFPKTQQKFNKMMKSNLYWDFQPRIKDAIKTAIDAKKYSIKERLERYSFLARYRGPIYSPQKTYKRNLDNSGKRINFENNTDLYLEPEIFALKQASRTLTYKPKKC